MKKSDLERIKKISRYCADIMEFAKNMSFDEFQTDKKSNYIVVFPLSQIGELAKGLSLGFKEKYNTVNWVGVASVRNRIVHDYEGLQWGLIWEIVQDYIPKLHIYIEEILEDLQ